MSVYVPSLTEIDIYGQEKTSSFDRALACAYIHVENVRKKGTGFLVKQPEEKISFLVQVLWPFLLVERVPGRRVVFDTFGFMKRHFHDGDATKLKEFSSQLEKSIPSLMNRPDFHSNLETFASYFQDFDEKKTYEIAGCFSEIERARDIVLSMRLGGSQENNVALFLPNAVDSKKATESVLLLSEIRRKANDDIETLKNKLLPLDSTLPPWHEQIKYEIEQKRLPYDKKIEEISPGVKKKISQIEKEKWDALAPLEPEISRMESEVRQLKEFERIHEAEERNARDDSMEAARNVDQAQEDIQEAIQELNIEQQTTYEDSCEESARNARISRLELRISHKRSRLSRAENRYSDAKQAEYECERATGEAAKKVKDAEDILEEKQQEYDDIKDEYDKEIAAEEYKITSLEEERDGITNSLNQEARDLTSKTEKIRLNVNELVKRKQQLISEIDNNDIPLGTGTSLKGVETYVYVPFFVAMLKESAGNRFFVSSPARLRKEKTAAEKLGGFILGKIPMLTERRDQTLSSLAKFLAEQLDTNSSIKNEICKKAGEHNLLNLTNAVEALSRGIDSLKSEGILNDKMSQKLRSSLPAKTTQSFHATTKAPPLNVRFVCPRCGTNICLDIDHCPNCGFYPSTNSSWNKHVTSPTPDRNKQMSSITPKNLQYNPNLRFVCQKCGTNVCLDIDHCPNCGTPAPNRRKRFG